MAPFPVMNIADQFTGPHLRERGTYAGVEHPQVGVDWVYGLPWLLSETPGSVRHAAPLLGEHNEYVLHQLLGLELAEVDRLQAAQAVY